MSENNRVFEPGIKPGNLIVLTCLFPEPLKPSWLFPPSSVMCINYKTNCYEIPKSPLPMWFYMLASMLLKKFIIQYYLSWSVHSVCGILNAEWIFVNYLDDAQGVGGHIWKLILVAVIVLHWLQSESKRSFSPLVFSLYLLEFHKFQSTISPLSLSTRDNCLNHSHSFKHAIPKSLSYLHCIFSGLYRNYSYISDLQMYIFQTLGFTPIFPMPTGHYRLDTP